MKMQESILNSFAREREDSFPNLLEDKDFAYYYWTLPICAL